ncbi:carboxymuconolactone decarboxylase family protein [Myxococcus sp. K15C18031901]|uniref:carboxymuconolactone decarboxylase family protein n=1 Tax=Myxococcus dinghuensis TaxID=2906761 RepID=UPI0020A6FE18|nr:carboxymuconolactone decarboxylase family protein [Myxococcus dinghuensis]MCP3103692.1 carboxymuconolactone decarboxylase family protein [Myxococcus dinghuensis]
MKEFSACMVAFACAACGTVRAPAPRDIAPTLEEVRAVSPALERYTREALHGDLWKRPGLSPRDRSLVTVATLIARNQTVMEPYHFGFALENGVTPAELSEVITHLAFYSGWANAIAAVAAAKPVFDARGIDASQLPAATGARLPLDEVAEEKRAAQTDKNFGQVAPGVVRYSEQLLFRDLWLRPDLEPRDRSLVTVSALVATGQVAQIAFHLNKAMDNGVTRSEVSEAMTQMAFYAGWPFVFSALPTVKDVLEKRPN